MEIGIFDMVIDFEPLEKTGLHLTRPKSKAIADIVKKQAGALWKKSAHEESLELDVIHFPILLHGKEVEDISVQDEEGIGAAVPAAGEFESPTTQRQAGGGSGGRDGRRLDGGRGRGH